MSGQDSTDLNELDIMAVAHAPLEEEPAAQQPSESAGALPNLASTGWEWQLGLQLMHPCTCV